MKYIRSKNMLMEKKVWIMKTLHIYDRLIGKKNVFWSVDIEKMLIEKQRDYDIWITKFVHVLQTHIEVGPNCLHWFPVCQMILHVYNLC